MGTIIPVNQNWSLFELNSGNWTSTSEGEYILVLQTHDPSLVIMFCEDGLRAKNVKFSKKYDTEELYPLIPS